MSAEPVMLNDQEPPVFSDEQIDRAIAFIRGAEADNAGR